MRQRITLLKDYIPQTIDEMKAVIRETLCEGEWQLSEGDVEAIERIRYNAFAN